MTKIIKNLILLLLLTGMTISVIPISANESLGSITIILEDTVDELSKENVEFGLTKIADIVHGEYISLEEYSHFDFNDIKTSIELKDTAVRINKLVSSNDCVGKTDEQGILKFENLEVGVYLLHPTYIADYEIIEPTLIAIPSWNETEGEMKTDIFVFPKHEPLPIIQIQKIDSKSNDLIKDKSFEFTLYADYECKESIASIHEINMDGILDFDITYGTYYLKETKAPNGYQLSDKIIKIEFNEEGVFINGVIAEKENGVYVLGYENEKIPTITPDTNDDSHMIIWYCIITFTILIPSLMLLAEDKDNEKNK